MSVVSINRETSPEIFNGVKTVGTAADKLTELQYKLARGVLIRAFGVGDSNPNTDPIWLGGERVTADATDTGGVPILPGASLFLPIDDPTKLYVISTSPGQLLAWIGL